MKRIMKSALLGGCLAASAFVGLQVGAPSEAFAIKETPYCAHQRCSNNVCIDLWGGHCDVSVSPVGASCTDLDCPQ